MRYGKLDIPAAPILGLDMYTDRGEKDLLDDAGIDYRDFLNVNPYKPAYWKRRFTKLRIRKEKTK